MRRPALFLAGTLAALGAVAIAAWAALPWVAETWGPGILEERLGIAPLRYTMDEVGLSRMVLRDIKVGPDGRSAGAETIILTYDLTDGRLNTLIIDRARVEAAWIDGALHIEGLGPVTDLLGAETTDTDAAATDALLPVDFLRVNAARLVLQSPHGIAEIIVDGEAKRTDDGVAAEASLSVTGPGLAAEASFALAGRQSAAAPWEALNGTGQLAVTARSAAIPGLAGNVDGFTSLSLTAEDGEIQAVSEEGLVLTARQLDDALLARLPAALQAQAEAGLTVVAGTAGAAPLHVFVSPLDGGYRVAGAGSVSARMGETTGRLTVDGEATVDGAGTLQTLALRQLEGVVNGLPSAGGMVHASLDGRDLSGLPTDGSVQVDLFILGQELLIDDISVPRLRMLMAGGLTWDDGGARLGLQEGRLSLDGPVVIGGTTLPKGLDWVIEPTGEDAAVVLTLADGAAQMQARLAVPDAALVVRSAGRTIDSRFARAEIDAVVPVGAQGNRMLTLTLSDGTMKAKDPAAPMEASGVYATVREGPTGISIEAEARVPHLPGEPLPLPEGTQEHRPLRIQASAEHPWDGTPTRFEAQVREGGLKTILRLDGRHDVATGKGSAKVTVPRLTFGDGLQPESLYGPLAAAALRIDGDMAVRGTVAWTPRGLTPRLEVLLDGLTIRRGFVELRQTHGVLAITKLWPLATPPDQVLAVGAIDAGVPFSNAEMTFRLDGKGNAVIDRAIMTLAEGTIHADPLVLPFDGSGAQTVLRVQGLRLDQLANLTELGGLSASGNLHGEVPVELRDGNILFHGGELRTDAPGTIRYRPAEAPAGLASGGAGVDLMLQALSDFHYDSLRLTVTGSAAGALEVGMHLAGNNPDLYSGYPVEFNLTLSGALAQVIEGSLTGYQVPDRIRRHMEQFGVEQ